MPHYVVIPDDPDESPELLHDASCVLVTNDGGRWIDQYDCVFEFEALNCGITWFFDHIDNEPSPNGVYYTEYLEPGTYEIEHWEERSNHYEYGPEYDAGLRTVEK